jgi:hypothetical protein
MGVTTMLFWVSFLSCLCLMALTVYYGMTCPTVANLESGHIYPFFDKIYGRYVYVTETEKDALPIFGCFGATCVFACVVLDLDLKRQFRSARKSGSLRP